tara:strand:+ start:1545 stop:2723 length:1179 start_codon:yes stop_codon:yes gene_type:complete
MKQNSTNILVRKLTDLQSEVENELNQIKGWQGTLLKSQSRVQTSGIDFPAGVEHIDINNVYIDHQVQRNIDPKHVAKIIERFDKRICMPAAGVKRDFLDGKVYVYDGQHRIMACAILGLKKIPVCIVVSNDATFPAYAFEVLNDSGIRKASKEDIHRVLLSRWRLGDATARADVKVKRAFRIQTIFDEVGIDLEGHKTRQSGKLKGNSNYFFSHFQYAYKGYEVLEERSRTGQLKNILSAIKEVYHDEPTGEIDQGLYIGLVEMCRLAYDNEDIFGNILKDPSWMKKLLEVIKKSTGIAKTFTQRSREQWVSVTGVGVDGPKTMAQIMYEVWTKFYKQHGYTQMIVPHQPDLDVGIIKDQPVKDPVTGKEKQKMTDEFRQMLNMSQTGLKAI